MNDRWETMLHEYEGCIMRQREVICVYRAQLNTAIRRRDFKEIKRLNSLLRILYEEKSELEERAAGIKDFLFS